MKQKQDSFLDKSTLMAIFLLGASWLLWDAHMKKKYANNQSTAKIPVVEKTKTETPIKLPVARAVLKTEQLYKYSGKRVDIVFSSRGFGVKEFRLKDFFDRKKQAIIFKSEDEPLFASEFLSTGDVIPFRITKTGRTYRGVFSTEDFQILKTIIIDEEEMILKTRIKITQKRASLKGMRIRFQYPFPDEGKGNGFIKMLTMYGRDIFKGFVGFEGKKQLLWQDDLEEGKTYKNVSIAALGGKYFGQAFVNKSPLLPRVKVTAKNERAQAQLEYEFLNSKPVTLEYLKFFGPKSFDYFKPLGPESRSWIDFGFFYWLAHPILFILKILYDWIQNWGLAIIQLTIFIRLLLFPINLKAYGSMKVMQKLQPEIKSLREKYKSEPQKLNVEIMTLMKKNRASPFGGCLPLFFQFPVFFALYRVLGESIELYQSPFGGWIQDLSAKDPYYILPVLAGVTLFVQQKITPMQIPAAQARLLTFMPLIFMGFMLGLPSGLTLYIFVSGVFGLIQQMFFVKFKK